MDEKRIEELSDEVMGIIGKHEFEERESFDPEVLAYLAYLKSENPHKSVEELIENVIPFPFVSCYLKKLFNDEMAAIVVKLQKRYSAAELKEIVQLAAENRIGRGFFDIEADNPYLNLSLGLLDIQPERSVIETSRQFSNLFTIAAKTQPKASYLDIGGSEWGAVRKRIAIDLLGSSYGWWPYAEYFITGDMRADRIFNWGYSLFEGHPAEVNAHYRHLVTDNGIDLDFMDALDWMVNKVVYDCLNPEGIAVTINPSVLMSHPAYRELRKYFVEKRMIRAVIAVPPYPPLSSDESTIFLVLGHNEGSIRFVDATDFHGMRHEDRTVKEGIVAQILDRVATCGPLSRDVRLFDIAREDYSLLPSRYLPVSVYKYDAEPVPLHTIVESIETGWETPWSERSEAFSRFPTPIRCVQPYDLVDLEVQGDPTYLSEKASYPERSIVRSGDILLAKFGTHRKVAIAEVPEGVTWVAGDELFVIRPDKDKVNTSYLASYLGGYAGSAILNSRFPEYRGSLSLDDLRAVPVPLPSIELQSKVGEVFEGEIRTVHMKSLVLEAYRRDLRTAFDRAMEADGKPSMIVHVEF